MEKLEMKNETTAQRCVTCGLIVLRADRCEVAEGNKTNAERYRRVREFLQRGDGFLDTRGMDDAGFDRMIDSLKERGK
jgi:hypothetical protein